MSSESRLTSRPIQSCFQCRKRKIKCNRTYPCAPCQLRGEGDSCREVDKSLASSSKTTVETLDDVVHRVAILEKTVLKLSKLLPPESVSSVLNEDRPPPRKKSSPTSSTSAQPSSATKSTIRAAFGRTSMDEDVAMMLEDFAMGHKVNRTRATQDLEVDSDPYSGVQPHSLGGLSETHPLALLIDPQTNVIGRLLSLLPDEHRSRMLIQFYFDRLEWYSKVLHLPTFLSECNLLHAQLGSSPNLIRLPFLGVYFMVLCLALHLIEPHICDKLGMTFTNAVELAKRMYSAAQACLHYDEFLGNHSLEHLQSIVLMGVYQQNLDEADAHWALMGSAIKIAQNLGVSRLGSESEMRTYSASWRSLIKRETARRIWWQLIFSDWSHAAAHNGTYSVHPSQNHTGYPANVNDSDIVDDGRVLTERGEKEYTEMTFSLLRLRLVELYRQVVDDMQSPTGYSFVVDMDAQLSRALHAMPSYFEGGDPGGVKELELTLSLIMGETRRLRLHRPYLFRGYKDRRYVNSREQCINSARAILDYLKSGDEQSAILLKWWIVLFYGFAAAVVLFIDLCHQKADGSSEKELERRRAELREALDLFKTAEHVSTVSRNAIALLEGLLTAEPELPSKPAPRSKKRGRPQDEEGDDEAEAEEDAEPFEKIVKRMIVEASKTIASPTSTASTAYSQHTQSPQVTSVASAANPYPSWQQPSASDILSPGVLFRDEGMFSGTRFDESTMAELGQLLYSDAYGWGS